MERGLHYSVLFVITILFCQNITIMIFSNCFTAVFMFNLKMLQCSLFVLL